MNIFYTSKCPKQSAHDHCTIHMRKMIIEYAQLLSTAHRLIDGVQCQNHTVLYKATHKNHPSAVWVRQSHRHYVWLYKCFAQLCMNYSVHSGKQHATATKLLKVLETPPINIPDNSFVTPPQCMPEEFHTSNCEISYKKYLTAKYKEWSNRSKPLKVDFLFKPSWV